MLFIKKKIKKFLGMIYWNILGNIFKILPIQEKNIYFESFLGRYYSDNPKAIAEYLNSQNYEYKIIWGFKEPEIKNINSNIIKVKRIRWKYLYYVMTSKYIINNSRMPLQFKKRKNQIYIQTWHGTPLKKLVYDMKNITLPGTSKDKYYTNFSKDVDKWNYLLVPNEFAYHKLISAFHYEGAVLKSGYPRNDLLKLPSFEKEKKINEIKKKLQIDKDKKIILYTPTFRDNRYIEKGKYIQDIMFDINKIKEMDPNIIFLMRTHYLIKELNSVNGIINFDNTFIDVSTYEDIVDLYLISDILITDYSSTFFDYSILKRPIILYQYDYKEYKEDLRGFYLSENQLPVKPIYTEEEFYIQLQKILINKESCEYSEEYKKLKLEEYQKESSEFIVSKIFTTN